MVSATCLLHRMSSRMITRKLWSFILVAVLMLGYLALYLQVMGGYSVTHQVLTGYITNDTQLKSNVYNTNTSVKEKTFADRVYIIPYSPQKSPSDSSALKFNCSNLHDITLKRKLGNGVSKQVLLGLYGEHKVAVKMVTRTVPDVTSCTRRIVQQFSNADVQVEDLLHKCYVFPNMKLMKEILLLQQLKHPNLLQMLGYCVRSEETESTSLQDHGVVAVYEYAVRFYTATLGTWPVQKRLNSAFELADLLHYLEHSPLGSLHIADFKDAHFLLSNGQHIKLTDMDDVSSQEPSCSDQGDKLCNYGLQCIGGICPGHNAKANMDNMYRLLFQNLLQEDPVLTPEVNNKMADILYRLQTLSINASQLKDRIKLLLDKLKTGRSR